MKDLARLAAAPALSLETQQQRRQTVYDEVLRQSRRLRSGQFDTIHAHDLWLLYRSYDQTFFEGALRTALGQTPLDFRLSRRLTKVAGKVTRTRHPVRGERYELAISTTLLFDNFRDVTRPVTVAGLPCRDRLDALQRIYEHELLHLFEFLGWGNSSCSAAAFHRLARNFFGHLHYRHDLITGRERAQIQFGLRVGQQVAFRFDGKHYSGLLNRITRRATVLVEHPQGRRYSDGKRYHRFYVPLEKLQPAQDAPRSRT